MKNIALLFFIGVYLSYGQPSSCDAIVDPGLTDELCRETTPLDGTCCMGVGCGSSGFCEGCAATDCDASTTNGPTTTDKATTTDALTTTEEPCETDADEDFRVDYIGKSTQFRIYNQCNDKQFLKIKMTDLTEYDSNNRKTTNKVTGFASTDWEWDNPNGVNTEYNGYRVVKNTFTATDVVGNADFILTTLLFKEDAVINDNKSVNVNSLKFNVEITDWPFLADENYLELCINLMTNKGNNDDDDEANGLWRAGEFEIETFDEAECGDNTINVNVSDATNGGGNQRNLCFTFDVCGEKQLFYDPIVRHVNEGANTIGTTNVGVIVGSIFGVLAFIGVVGLVYWFVSRNKMKGAYSGLLDT